MTTPQPDELAPCPVCGASVIGWPEPPHLAAYTVECSMCSYSVPTHEEHNKLSREAEIGRLFERLADVGMGFVGREHVSRLWLIDTGYASLENDTDLLALLRTLAAKLDAKLGEAKP